MYREKFLQYSLYGDVFIPENKEEQLEWTQYLLESSIASGDDDIREGVTLQLVKAKQIVGKHDWDGTLGNLKIEVKNETQPKAKSSRLNGSGLFNNLSWNSIEKYRDKNGIYMQAGYTRKGRLVYCVAFRMHHILPILQAKLEEFVPKDPGEKDTKDVQVSISVKDFPDELEVIYMSPNLLNHTKLSDRLFNLITSNWTARTQIRSARLAPKSLSTHD